MSNKIEALRAIGGGSALTTDARKNRLLAALPPGDFRRLAPCLEPVTFAVGDLVYRANAPMTHAYFLVDSIVSLIYVMKDGRSAEIALVGSEGLVGVPLYMGGGSTTSEALVQSTGKAFRIGAETLQEEFARGGALQQLLLRYAQALLTQMAQTAVCNRHHSLDKQLCRWILLSLDRLPGNELTMTQELIANMLGVRREGVTEAAGKLQAAGLIRYSRGRITVLDRPGLEHRVCECYGVVRRELDRLLPIPRDDA